MVQVFRNLLAVCVIGYRQTGFHHKAERFTQREGFINLGHHTARKICHLIAMPHGFHDARLTGCRDHQMGFDIVMAASQFGQLFLIAFVRTGQSGGINQHQMTV